MFNYDNNTNAQININNDLKRNYYFNYINDIFQKY